MESRLNLNDEDTHFDQVDDLLLDDPEILMSDDEEDEDYLSGLGESTEDTEFHEFSDSTIRFSVDEEDM